MTIARVIAKAWRDEDYKTKLLSDPHAALTEQASACSSSFRARRQKVFSPAAVCFQRLFVLFSMLHLSNRLFRP